MERERSQKNYDEGTWYAEGACQPMVGYVDWPKAPRRLLLTWTQRKHESFRLGLGRGARSKGVCRVATVVFLLRLIFSLTEPTQKAPGLSVPSEGIGFHCWRKRGLIRGEIHSYVRRKSGAKASLFF